MIPEEFLLIIIVYKKEKKKRTKNGLRTERVVINYKKI